MSEFRDLHDNVPHLQVAAWLLAQAHLQVAAWFVAQEMPRGAGSTARFHGRGQTLSPPPSARSRDHDLRRDQYAVVKPTVV